MSKENHLLKYILKCKKIWSAQMVVMAEIGFFSKWAISLVPQMFCSSCFGKKWQCSFLEALWVLVYKCSAL